MDLFFVNSKNNADVLKQKIVEKLFCEIMLPYVKYFSVRTNMVFIFQIINFMLFLSFKTWMIQKKKNFEKEIAQYFVQYFNKILLTFFKCLPFNRCLPSPTLAGMPYKGGKRYGPLSHCSKEGETLVVRPLPKLLFYVCLP